MEIICNWARHTVPLHKNAPPERPNRLSNNLLFEPPAFMLKNFKKFLLKIVRNLIIYLILLKIYYINNSKSILFRGVYFERP